MDEARDCASAVALPEEEEEVKARLRTACGRGVVVAARLRLSALVDDSAKADRIIATN